MRPETFGRFLAAASLLAFAAPWAANAQPRIEVAPGQLDFGTLQQHETREARVTVRNAGDKPLVIGDVRTTCHCVEPELAVRELAPGASAEMEVLFSSLEFQGAQIKYLKIYSNDPRRSVVDFLVTADIKAPLYMTPEQNLVQFPPFRTGRSATRTFTFRSEDVPRLEIDPGSWPSDWLDVAVRRGEDPQQVEVDFTARPEGPAGRHRGTIRLATNVPAAPTVTLEADATTVADLVLGMQRVNLGAVRAGDALQTRIPVTPLEPGIAFRLTGASIDIPGLEAEVVNDGNGSYAVIGGEAMAGNHPQARQSRGRIQGTLRIFSDLESTPELQVPVTYMLRR